MMKSIRQVAVLSALFLCIIITQSVASGVSGQILNIDNSTQTVFCDLTTSHVSAGDIVGVYQGNALITFLTVDSTKPSLSILKTINDRHFQTKDNDFSRLTIGQQIYKINTKNYEGSVDVLLSEVYKASYDNQQLLEKLKDQQVINRTVEEENALYRKKIDEMEKTISSLKQNLINVKGILDEKIQSYQ